MDKTIFCGKNLIFESENGLNLQQSIGHALFSTSRSLLFFFYIFLSASLICMTIGPIGKISIFYFSGFFFYYLLLIHIFYWPQAFKIKIGWAEAAFYLYPFLMFLSALWSINPGNTLFFASIAAVINTGIYFFVCRVSFLERVQISKKLSVIIAFVGLITAIILYFKHGGLRGPDIKAFGIELMYENVLAMPFLIMQLMPFYGNPKAHKILNVKAGSFSNNSGCFSKMTILLCLIAVVIVNIMTLSRLAVASILLIPIIYLSLYYGVSKRMLWISTLVTVVLVVVVGVLTIIKPDLSEKYSARFVEFYQVVNEIYDNRAEIKYLKPQKSNFPELGRVLMYRNAYDIIVNNFALGVGYQNAAQASYAISGYGKTIHNFFLGSFAEMGLTGFILSFLLVCLGIWRGLKKIWIAKKYCFNELKAYYAASLTAF
ncbi:MAG: O-antigen ligase family protein, partial [Desulfobacteraceae bacterium]|nr:O-antigen ligase family protein [Desulfobacteraceae bacterium]